MSTNMQRGILRELKNLHKFIDKMERSVRTGRDAHVYPAYVFLKTLCYHMNEGDLSPDSINLHHELLRSFKGEND